MQLYADLSDEEILKALAISIALCEREENFQVNVVRALREMQRKIRWRQEASKRANERQPSIKPFFN